MTAKLSDGDLRENGVRENVRRTVERLRNFEANLQEPIEQGRLRIVGAKYDLDDGVVDFFIE